MGLVSFFPGIALSAENSVTHDLSVTEHDVLPILLRRCANCHGATYQEGDLDLRSRASILKGGKSGAAITPGKPDASLLLKKVAGDEMPPKEDRGRAGIEDVTPGELEMIRRWIINGAPETPPASEAKNLTKQQSDHWAFQSPQKPAVPKVKDSKRIRNEIDAFLLAKLESNHLDFSPGNGSGKPVPEGLFHADGLTAPAGRDSSIRG